MRATMTDLERPSDRSRDGERPTERRRWFEGMLSHLTEGILAVDPRGHVSYMNPAAEALT